MSTAEELSTLHPPLTTHHTAWPRRLLAVFALLVSILAVTGVFLAPVGPPRPLQALQSDAAGTFAPPRSLPRLCADCGAAAPAWVTTGRGTIVTGPDAAPHVDPRLVGEAAVEAPPDRRFGVVAAFTAPYAASYMGVGWERVNFDWRALQPAGPHSWNRAAVSGAMLAREIAAGREIVGIIGSRPAWAVDARGLPRGLYLPASDPRNVWGAFVAELARRYRGRIRHWIVWNEPDVWDRHVRGYTWPGTVDDFARLQEVAYVRIKAVDPTLVVHLAATTYWWDAAYGRPLYFARLLDALARDPAARARHWYFDVASAHIYNVPDDVARIIALDRALMHNHGFGKPIWLVETDAAPTLDGAWSMSAPRQIASAGQQAAYVAQATVLALAAGAARVEFYKMTDPAALSPRAYPSGLVRPDGTARPVVAALRATTHALAGWTGATDLGTRAGIRAVAVARERRAGTLVLWNTTTTALTATVAVPLPAGAGTATGSAITPSWLGARIAAVADDDTRLTLAPTIVGGQAMLRVPLPASTCAPTGGCRIGGAPIMVVAPALPRLLPG